MLPRPFADFAPTSVLKIFGFAAYSGSGKTTLIENLVPLFVARGLKVSLIKHAHHAFDVDQPGKDSYRHRQAGATERRSRKTGAGGARSPLPEPACVRAFTWIEIKKQQSWRRSQRC